MCGLSRTRLVLVCNCTGDLDWIEVEELCELLCDLLLETRVVGDSYGRMGSVLTQPYHMRGSHVNRLNLLAFDYTFMQVHVQHQPSTTTA